ncbi:MAG: SGNH/GDSL hydrolase family protein [Thermoanaerobaculia bacterium]
MAQIYSGGAGATVPPLIAIAIWLLAAVLVGCRASRPEPLTAPRHATSTSLGSGAPLLYLVLGDSTAAGVGADYEQGIVMATARHLGRSRRVEVVNVAVSGARFRDVISGQLPRARGIKPDLVLLDVGANDVTHLTSSRSVRRDLEEILRSLLAANCEARIVVTGAPDMGSPPRIPFFLRGIAAVRARRMNRIARRAVTAHGLTFAAIAERTGPAFRRDRTLFASDRFHPNARGYALWAAVLDEALDAALAEQPGHCASDRNRSRAP